MVAPEKALPAPGATLSFLKKEIMRHFLFSSMLLWCGLCSAQEAITSSYGSATLGGQVYDWTLGDMAAIETIENTTLIVTQGFLQPVSGAISTNEPRLPFGSVQVFPNPTHGAVQMNATFDAPVILRYAVLDITGKLLLENMADNVQASHAETIDLSTFAAGTYLLRVEADKVGWEFFKIVKVSE